MKTEFLLSRGTLVVLFLVTAVSPTFAQTISLTVIITDDQGARIPDLSVTISLELTTSLKQNSGQNATKAFAVSGKTDASGEFRAELPGPGVYYVHVEPMTYVINLTQGAKPEETFTFVWSGKTPGTYNPIDQPGTIGLRNEGTAVFPVSLLIFGMVVLVITLLFLKRRGRRDLVSTQLLGHSLERKQ